MEKPAETLAPTVELCDVCGAPCIEIHCKVICKNCGYVRDCSDP